MTLEYINSIAYPIIKGLQILHRNRIIHHNIKSHNILIFLEVTGKLKYKLADFGAFGQFNDGPISL